MLTSSDFAKELLGAFAKGGHIYGIMRRVWRSGTNDKVVVLEMRM